ncbi:uncharacterized protein N7459_002682 [Penicillium hispanicum]|uniref:uncharacterized protein n=1 Tax=Penicillium hispanicum TaxID=1080232 RepID=UPI00254268FF|nr:uncharacterized protein N7459_002682 [Penicillium hispanicum]KAJ5586917.1 hypothetical protein N7459_002682 [Penicillium hispanicum]
MSFHSASPEGAHHSHSPTSDHSRHSPSALPGTAPAPRPLPDSASSRSCVTCRRRKVRCNKRSPCSNCTKAGIDCIFPPPGRAPRKSKRPPDAELLSRLRRLEGVIEHLSGRNGEQGSTSSTSPQQPAASNFGHASLDSSAAATTATTASAGSTAPPPAQSNPQNGSGCPFEDADPKKPTPSKFENEFGRLVIDEGKSRYVSNRLWASLGDELQDLLDHSSSDEEDTPSPASASSYPGSHDGFIFGFHSLSQSLRECHPPLPKVSKFWEAYRENVAPLVTILHRPSARNLLIEAAQRPEYLDKNSEALVFTIYLSAVVSLKPDECLSQLGEDRATAVKRYRFYVEQALARANLLNTQSLVLLQAAVLFLICVRREDDTKFVWSMTSVILRLAQGLGLHRDGTNFALKPFETEMRRRLWWHLSLMDFRSSEDHGTDPLINEGMYDTRLPLNVNDDDLQPDMVEAPEEREGCTDVLFLLIRCEITQALRRANYTCPGARFRFGGAPPPMDRSERMIQIISNRVEERYIKRCNMNVPIQWASATVGRLILAKLWLIVHHPMTQRGRSTGVSQATRQSLFLTAIEVLEFGRLLEADPKTAKWGWLFRTNMQWHGIAFVLSEVCVRPICPVTDRAWNAINSLYSDWKMQGTHKKGMLWRPLAALMKRASAVREKQQEELRLKFGPEPISFSPSSPDPLAGLDHRLPQIHMPNEPSVPLSSTHVNQNDQMGATSLNVDLSGGPLATLEAIFPDTNWLAPTSIGNPPPADSIANPNIPSGLPFNAPTSSTLSNPFMTQENLSDQDPLTWDDWDQVMRDFQMDVEKDGSGVANGTSVTEWFA